MQNEITQKGKLLSKSGALTQAGWMRQPLLDCNLEDVAFYPRLWRFLQPWRVKRWDYYAVFTPKRFFSATIAHLGYAGNVFVYTVDFETPQVHEEGLVIPFGKGIYLARNSDKGETSIEGKRVRLSFSQYPERRELFIEWPSYHQGRGLLAEISLACPLEHESMTIVIPIGRKRFYYNRKINSMPASGKIHYGHEIEYLSPESSLGSLDWGRGVWEYRSFWNWASASGFLSDGRRFGLNFGKGFGDLSKATENCVILDGRVHKLNQVSFEYDPQDFMRPWKFEDDQGRLALEFVPFVERVARTNLLIITSEVHQIFGRYSGRVLLDDGDELHLDGLIGFAEEHHARW